MTGGAAGAWAHTVVALALILAYITVTVTGNDGTALLGALGGYLGGAATQKAAAG